MEVPALVSLETFWRMPYGAKFNLHNPLNPFIRLILKGAP